LDIGGPVVLLDLREDLFQFGDGADLGRKPSLATESFREEEVIQLSQIIVDMATLADMKAFIAVRPPRTPLDTAKFTRATGITPPPWKEAVEAYFSTWKA